MINSGTINLLAFPQQWEPPVLTLNVLILPKGDPFAMAPPFPTCTLQLEAACTRGLEALPTAAAVALRNPLAFAVPGNRPALFAELADRIPVRAQAPGIVPDPPLRVKKAVVSSYIDATGNGRSRTSFLVSGDEYDCALRDSDAAKPKLVGPPPDDFYWEEIYGFVLRQPILARELGLVVLDTSVDV